jgi:hypothetical protein
MKTRGIRIMGTPTNRIRDIDEALREISAAAGAGITIETTRKHRRAVYTFNGRSRFDVLSGSPTKIIGAMLKTVSRPGGMQSRRSPSTRRGPLGRLRGSPNVSCGWK